MRPEHVGRGLLSRKTHKHRRRCQQLSREEIEIPVRVCKERAEPERYLLYRKEKGKSETWMSLWGFQSES